MASSAGNDSAGSSGANLEANPPTIGESAENVAADSGRSNEPLNDPLNETNEGDNMGLDMGKINLRV